MAQIIDHNVQVSKIVEANVKRALTAMGQVAVAEIKNAMGGKRTHLTIENRLDAPSCIRRAR